jgi:peptidoglycan-associated lipoprotein
MARTGIAETTPRSLTEERLTEESSSRRNGGAITERGTGRASEGRNGSSGTMVARIPEAGAAIPPAVAVSSPLKNVYFQFDKYDLKDESRETLKGIAEWLAKNPKINLLIEGHTDDRGTDEYNLALGERRADAALRYLRQLGISGDRLSTVSYGEMRPANPGQDEDAWEKNRRDSFVVIAR